jgi:hypothetical protein
LSSLVRSCCLLLQLHLVRGLKSNAACYVHCCCSCFTPASQFLVWYARLSCVHVYAL